MVRQIVDLNGLEELSPFTKHQIYKLTKRQQNPIPLKKDWQKTLF